MVNTLWLILLSSAFGLGILISAACVSSTNAGRLQKAWFLTAVAAILIILFDYITILAAPPQRITAFPSTPFFFVFAPAFYLFIRASVFPQASWKAVSLLHFVPAALLLLNHGNDLDLMVAHNRRFEGQPLFAVNPYLLMALHTLQALVYVTLSRRLCRRVPLQRKLSSYLNISITSLLILAVSNAMALAGFYLLPQHNIHVEFLLTLGFAIGIYTLAWPCLLISKLTTAAVYDNDSSTSRRYRDIYTRFESLMDESRLYLQPDLRQAQVAAELRISRQDLSAALNQVSQSGFNELINAYRINAVLDRLHQPQPPAILEAAMDAGFNSKATFNRAFRQHTGQTPTDYLKNRRRNDKRVSSGRMSRYNTPGQSG